MQYGPHVLAWKLRFAPWSFRLYPGAQIAARMVELQPGGTDCSLETQKVIQTAAAWGVTLPVHFVPLRLRLQPNASDCSLEAQIASWKVGKLSRMWRPVAVCSGLLRIGGSDS